MDSPISDTFHGQSRTFTELFARPDSFTGKLRCVLVYGVRETSESEAMKVLITVGAIFGFFGSLSVTNNHRESDIWWAVISAAFFAGLLPFVARLGVNWRETRKNLSGPGRSL